MKKRGGISVVTRVVKTSGWALASIKRDTFEGQFTLNVPVGGIAFADVKGKYQVVNEASVFSRAGPPDRSIDPEYVKKNLTSGFPRDQTVFIRTLTIKHRLWGSWKVIEAGGAEGSPGSDPPSDDHNSPQLEAIEEPPREEVRFFYTLTLPQS